MWAVSPIKHEYDSKVLHWNLKVVMMPTLSILSEAEAVLTITSGAGSDDKVGIMATLGFQSKVVFEIVLDQIRLKMIWADDFPSSHNIFYWLGSQLISLGW